MSFASTGRWTSDARNSAADGGEVRAVTRKCLGVKAEPGAPPASSQGQWEMGENPTHCTQKTVMHVSKTVSDLNTQEIYLQSIFPVAVGCVPAKGFKDSCE